MNRNPGWTADDIPDQTGRVVLVTGASSGLGLATARAVAHRGARVILAVRDPEKGRRAAQGIDADVRRVDLADLDSVREFAEGVRAAYDRLDVLVNNAGVMAPPRTLSPQGHEVQFAVNHLGHFALTGLLLDRLAAGRDARVVTVSSVNHRQGTLYFDDLSGARSYHPMRYYNQSKLANAVFGRALHRRLAGSGVRSLLAHPGYARTNLQVHGVAGFLYGRLLAPLAQPPERGALPLLYAATSPDAEGGAFYGPGGAGELRGGPVRVAVAERADDEETGRRLWELSQEATGVSYADRVTDGTAPDRPSVPSRTASPAPPAAPPPPDRPPRPSR